MASRKNQHSRSKALVIFIISVLFIIIGIFISKWIGGDIIEGRASTKWPTTSGKIISSELLVRFRMLPSPGYDYTSRINYEFTVNEKNYSSWRISYKGSASKQEVENYPKDKSVTVYYNPDNPSSSVLEPGINWISYIPLIFGLIFLLFGVIGMLSFILMIMHLRKDREALTEKLPVPSNFFFKIVIGVIIGLLPLLIFFYKNFNIPSQLFPNTWFVIIVCFILFASLVIYSVSRTQISFLNEILKKISSRYDVELSSTTGVPKLNIKINHFILTLFHGKIIREIGPNKTTNLYVKGKNDIKKEFHFNRVKGFSKNLLKPKNPKLSKIYYIIGDNQSEYNKYVSNKLEEFVIDHGINLLTGMFKPDEIQIEFYGELSIEECIKLVDIFNEILRK